MLMMNNVDDDDYNHDDEYDHDDHNGTDLQNKYSWVIPIVATIMNIMLILMPVPVMKFCRNWK